MRGLPRAHSSLRSTCIVCGEPAPTDRTCYACTADTPIAGVVHVGPYRNPVLQSAIKRLKFNAIRALAGPLGDLLARQILAAGLLPATLVPVPLHPRRERERGYNQARLLAVNVGNVLQLPVTNFLTRTRASSPQTSIIESPRARRRNVARVFAPRSTGAPMPERIILIDDVLTTGATLSEAAAVLQAEGSSEVWGAVVARG